MDVLRILLSLSPIGSTIELRPQAERFRSFDEKILLVYSPLPLKPALTYRLTRTHRGITQNWWKVNIYIPLCI
jgi:hypothetical protein